MANKKPLIKELSHDQLKAICRLRPSLRDCAAFFDVSEDTIMRRCREYEDSTFAEFRDKYMVDTRLTLVRNALKMANNGNTAMMIFCLKNLNKWQDKIDVEHGVADSFVDWVKQVRENESKQISGDVVDVDAKDSAE
ncbi:MAG: hypothetical protein GY861_17955 [bacterium]|nr:hypothetical protein [bacterium]